MSIKPNVLPPNIIPASGSSEKTLYESCELLMNEHGGDCYSFCAIACKADLDTAVISRMILCDRMDKAAGYAFRKLVFPELLSHICGAACQNACRRKKIDKSVDIPALHSGKILKNYKPVELKKNGKTATVSGNSPECWSAAHFLNLCGIQVTVIYSDQKIFPVQSDTTRQGLILDIERLEKSGISFISMKSFTMPDTIPDYILNGSITGKLEVDNIKEINEEPENNSLLNRIVTGRQIVRELLLKRRILSRKSPSRIHGFSETEKTEYLKHFPPPDDVSSAKAQAESCLLCGCSAGDNCRIKTLALRTGARQKRGDFLRHIEPAVNWGALEYEFAKCISCGLCIVKSRETPESPSLGQAFKGLKTRVIHLDNRTFRKKEAIALIKVCPTGALSLRRRFES